MTDTATAHAAARRGTDLAARLEAAHQVIDDRFVTAARDVAAADAGIASLIASLERLVSALDIGAVSRTTADLQSAIDALAALPARNHRRQRHIAELAARQAVICGHLKDLAGSLAYMRAFAMYIRVTAGGIAAADKEFSVFAGEIMECIGHGCREVAALEAGLSDLQRSLRAAESVTEALAERIAEHFPAVPDMLRASATVVDEHYRRISTVGCDAKKVAIEIRRSVGQILVGLQIGDATRQRIEHIQAAVARLDQSTLAPSQAAHVHALLAAQIQDTADDFHRELTKIALSMEALNKHARALSGLRDAAYGRDKIDDGGFLNRLARQVANAQSLVGEIEAADHTAIEARRESADTAKAMNSGVNAIRTIKKETQYLALNASLKSKRLGDVGQPLAVIAQELHLHCADLDAGAAAAMAAIAGLAESATATDEDDQAAKAATMLGEVIERIREAGDNTEREVADFVRMSDEILQQLEHSQRHLEFKTEIGAVLRECADTFQSLSEGAACRGGDLEAFLADLSALYTMAKERTIHEQFCGTFASDRERAA